ncbi:MAG: 16S rRNA (cytosine(1402)-N(4))-methyltransferase RsmH [Ignavibacteria bacterium]|nr:16S rRNA (cytosine(1402)-N(4))-methyltransferase RsmH [Ignavibacteria bacterium]
MNEATNYFHVPVLLHKTVEYLINPGIEKHTIVDCTSGGGGHSELILERIGKSGKLICIDKDDKAIKHTEDKLKILNNNFEIVQGNFSELDKILNSVRISSVTGILMDLGLSSYQIENEPGFSFMKDSELDMRADRREGEKASDIINYYKPYELQKIFYENGDIPNAKRLVGAIIKQRRKEKIKTTADLVKVINTEYSLRKKEANDFYAKIFQALRITVNNELENLKIALSLSGKYLVSGGRIVIISYHSLEDRIVKNFFRNNGGIFKKLTKKPVIPEYKEVKENRRSRSAKLRAAEKF